MFFLSPICFMDSIGDVLQAYVSVREFLEFSNFLTYPRYNSFRKVIAMILFFIMCSVGESFADYYKYAILKKNLTGKFYITDLKLSFGKTH